jgi:hypothetical protein
MVFLNLSLNLNLAILKMRIAHQNLLTKSIKWPII